MKAKKRVVKKQAKVLIPRKYVEAVERGVQFLDLLLGRKVWLKRIDLKKFDITDQNTCVAGSVFKETKFFGDLDEDEAEIDDGYDKFKNAIKGLGDGNDVVTRLGFYTPTDKGFQYLQDLWVMKIKQLKARTR